MTWDLVVIALGVALEPLPLTGFIVVMSAEGGRRKGFAFLMGWLLSLVVVVAATLALTGNEPPKPATAPSTALIVVKMLIGVGLLAFGVRRIWVHRRPRPPKDPPRWQQGVDRMSPWVALALGAGLQPWGLVAAGAATVAEAKVSGAADVLALVVFCLIGTAPYLVAVVLAAVDQEGTVERLARLRGWLDAHTDTLIIGVSVGLGLYLLARGVAALA